MKILLIIIYASLNLFFGSAQAGWLDSDDKKKIEKANVIVEQCVQIIQENSNKGKDKTVKVEVFAGDIKILSEYVVLTKIILLLTVNDYLTKQEKEGVCRYIPDTKSISWQPIVF